MHVKVEEADRSDWPQKSAEEISDIIQSAYLAGTRDMSDQKADNAYDYMMMVGPMVMAGPVAGVDVREALASITDDYMTSEAHHPGYVLIPTAKFEELRALGEALTRQPTSVGAIPEGFKCAALNYQGQEPQDCNWPYCGCDAKATEVLQVLDEHGYDLIDRHASKGPPNKEDLARAIYVHTSLHGEERGSRDHLAAVFGKSRRRDFQRQGDNARRAADAVLAMLQAAPQPTPERAGREVSPEEVEVVARAICRYVDAEGDPEPIEQQRVDREWRAFTDHAHAALDAILGLRSMGVGSDV